MIHVDQKDAIEGARRKHRIGGLAQLDRDILQILALNAQRQLDETGLPPRDNVPQVVIFASGTGGSGGMLIDLGYAVRRVLARVTPSDPQVTAFVYASAPTHPGTSDHELANLYATLTELNHFADEDVTFTAHYGGPEGPKVEGQGLRAVSAADGSFSFDLPPGRYTLRLHFDGYFERRPVTVAHNKLNLTMEFGGVPTP